MANNISKECNNGEHTKCARCDCQCHPGKSKLGGWVSGWGG